MIRTVLTTIHMAVAAVPGPDALDRGAAVAACPRTARRVALGGIAAPTYDPLLLGVPPCRIRPSSV